MKKTLIAFVILLFAISVMSVSSVYAKTPSPSDEKKVEKKVSETNVYIKKGGKKYHRKNCSLVKTGKTQITLSEATEKGYTACKVCIKVFVNENSKKFHQKECKMIKEGATELSISDVIKKEFTPCKLCHPVKKKEKK